MSKLNNLIKEINKKYKLEIITKGVQRFNTEKIPFTSLRANYMTYGGIARGKLIEFAGEENGGKTTTALDIVANAQKIFKKEWENEIKELEQITKPKKEEITRLQYLKTIGEQKVFYADCENTLDIEWAKLLGVKVDELILFKPDTQTAEQIFEITLSLLETGEVGLIIIDSLGVLLSSQAYEKTMEEKTYGGIASALTLFSKKAQVLCAKYNCTLIGINQVRENLASTYGGVITTGGRAWKHNCSMRLNFRKGSFIDEKGNEIKRSSENPQGNLVLIDIMKTKVCKPNRRTGFYILRYRTGIDDLEDLIDMGIKFELIEQMGSWFCFIDNEIGEIYESENGEELKIQGKANLRNYLKNNIELLNKLNIQIQEEIMKES